MFKIATVNTCYNISWYSMVAILLDREQIVPHSHVFFYPGENSDKGFSSTHYDIERVFT